MSRGTVPPDGAHLLLGAGATLPAEALDTITDDRADAILARRYTHPALGDRVVVRLVPQALGPAEDLALDFLGFDPQPAPVAVGVGRRQALGFPAWVLVHDPANGHHALALVKDLERLTRQARTKAGAAKDAFTDIAVRLGRSVPHFLPTFYEQAGRAFLAADNTTFAAQMFSKAREAERIHALPVDEDRLREVFLEFTLAGALSAKALSEYARDLVVRADPAQAYTLFRKLAVERVFGGMPPYTAMAKDLRRLAKAAGLDAAAEDDAVVREVLDLPAVARAPVGFWKDYRATIVRLARADGDIRERLLGFFPAAGAGETESLWLDILDESGALAGLTEVGDDPRVRRPRDGAVGWLERAIRWRRRRSWAQLRSPQLLALVEAMADRLRAEGTPIDPFPQYRQLTDLDLVDLLLALGMDLVIPDDLRGLSLDRWMEDEAPGRRDLVALAGAGWARPLLLAEIADVVGRGRRSEPGSAAFRQDLAPLLDETGARTLFAEWLQQIGESLVSGALPAMEAALDRLKAIAHPEVLAVEPTLRERIAAADPGRALARTLRIGIFDEFGWPALEEAAWSFPKPAKGNRSNNRVQVSEAWPALVLANEVWAVAAGPDRVLARHDVRDFPDHPRATRRATFAEYVDGQFLISWAGAGYWTGRPDEVFEMPYKGSSVWYDGCNIRSMPLPTGGRTTGWLPVLVGDRDPGDAVPLLHDGTTWYRLEPRRYPHPPVWREYDPGTGDGGRECLPAFLEDGLGADGAVLVSRVCQLAPVPAGLENSPLGTADGMLGWRAVTHPDGSVHGFGVDGRCVHLSPAQRAAFGGAVPVGVLHLPDGTPVTVLRDRGRLRLTDGKVTGSLCDEGSSAGRYTRGTPHLPPFFSWHALRPRDVAGSAALRALDRGGDLLAAGPDGVARVLPEITHPGLLAGVAGVVEIAVGCRETLERLSALGSSPAGSSLGGSASSGPRVNDTDLAEALTGFGPHAYRYGRNTATADTVASLVAATTAVLAVADGADIARVDLPTGGRNLVDWTLLVGGLGAVALRAASEATPPARREVLLDFLDAVAATSLADQDHRWRVVELTGTENLAGDRRDRDLLGRITRSTDGAVVHVAVGTTRSRIEGTLRATTTVLEFSRTGRFTSFPGFVVRNTRTGSGWSGAQRVRDLIALVREQGPAPWSAPASAVLAGPTGLSQAEATLLLAGMPGVDSYEHNFLDPHTREVLGLKVAEARAARSTMAGIDLRGRLELCAAAVPADVTDLWRTGPDAAAVAKTWLTAFGRRVTVPDDLLTEASRLISGYRLSVPDLLTGLLDPETCPFLTTDARVIVVDGQPRWQHDENAFAQHHLDRSVAGLVWLAYRMDPTDPLRTALPRAYTALRERLANPDLRVSVLDRADLTGLRRAYGHPARAQDYRGVETLALGEAGILTHTSWGQSLSVRPALLTGADDPLLAVAAGSDGPTLTALRLVLSGGLERLLAVAGPVPGWAQDPLVSVPDLVTRVREDTGLEEDPARVYLQILALPDPNEANVARWNGWTRTRVRRATAPLVAAGFLVEGKRARAGRSAFLPGGWLAVKAPFPPVETWKVPLLGFDPTGRPPLGVPVPTVPLPDLFTAAWERVAAGDGPALETLRTGKRKGTTPA